MKHRLCSKKVWGLHAFSRFYVPDNYRLSYTHKQIIPKTYRRSERNGIWWRRIKEDRRLKRRRPFHHHRRGRKRPVPIISNIPQSISTRLKLPPIVIIWQLQRHPVGRLWDLRSVPTTNVRPLVPFAHPHPLSLSTPYVAARLALRDLVPSARRHEY